ncbi:MAG TPA: uracil-DNA glycosylase [Thermoanaerobaculia bacterium]|jgi:DNA polymerase|nr:uracil-DNA glycosylase [Thermoanaerobaculia bacterium]
MNRPELAPPLRDLLGYLADIGYGDLYAPQAQSPEPSEPNARSASPTGGSFEPRAQAPSVARVAPADLAARVAELAEIEQRVSVCTRCRLSGGRTRTVFGAGNPAAELMFIGEGPGAEEDKQGLPFVGRAGELLTRIVQAIELRREDVYIANIVKCRPPGNRDPQPDEVSACRGYLERQIELIQPRVIVALGRIAAQTLLGNEDPIGRMRGRWYKVLGVSTMVTYHPAALLRNPALKRPTWEDMQQVRDRLREG